MDKKVPFINSFHHSEIDSNELGLEKIAFSKASNPRKMDKKVPIINSFHHGKINSSELGLEEAAFSNTAKSIQKKNIVHHC